MADNKDRNNIATNSKAFHEYFIDSKLECGISLLELKLNLLEQARLI